MKHMRGLAVMTVVAFVLVLSGCPRTVYLPVRKDLRATSGALVASLSVSPSELCPPSSFRADDPTLIELKPVVDLGPGAEVTDAPWELRTADRSSTVRLFDASTEERAAGSVRRRTTLYDSQKQLYLAPGDYVIEVPVRANGELVTAELPFKVKQCAFY